MKIRYYTKFNTFAWSITNQHVVLFIDNFNIF